jgi:adenine-specific DNA-methyltransferase
MATVFTQLEQQRLTLQTALDAEKTPRERNRMGQFATPSLLALDILRYAGTLLPAGQPIHFLDPAIGTGSFFSALQSLFGNGRVVEASGFEIDPHYGLPSKSLWNDTGLSLHISDFTAQAANPSFNLLICNPPYVRHHHMSADEKSRLQQRTFKSSGIRISGLAGLYCHFLGIAHSWMSAGGLAGWLIPSEFMDVNYGEPLKEYLLNTVTLLHIHRFDPSDVQFTDALVSSTVVWFKNTRPPPGHSVTFSFGGPLSAPRIVRSISKQHLARESKWTRFPIADVRPCASVPRLSDFFKITRGIATGDNSFFILPAHELTSRGLPQQAFRPILPSPRYLLESEVNADENGNPLIARRLFLLDTHLREGEIQKTLPELWRYLEEGKARKVHERYLCMHRPIWYAQEHRPAPPIVCTYLGRSDNKSGRPFRFILNHSQATIPNVYLAMYPKPALATAMQRDAELLRKVFDILNEISPEDLLGEGRVYGGGLHKMEPKELANVPAAAIAGLLPRPGISEGQLEMADLLF